MTQQTADVSSTLLNFDLLPDSMFVPIETLAQLMSASTDTIRRRIADGALPPPVGVIGLQRYQVGMIREILAGRDFMALDDPNGGFDVPLNDANYAEESHV
jgi:hypothetical protein